MVDKQAKSTPSSSESSNLLSANEGHERAGTVSMTSHAYDRLRSDIMSGALKPGMKLKVESLRKRYDVGSSPIREALSALSSEYLVERMDQRGFRVALISIEAFNELLKTRCWLEERALRESIAHGGSDWEEQVVLAMYHLSRAPRFDMQDDLVISAEWEVLHKRFHMSLISGCGSKMLLSFCDQLYDQNILYRHTAILDASSKRDVGVEHDAIADAALARDADRAVSMLIAHYEQTGNALKERMKGLA